METAPRLLLSTILALSALLIPGVTTSAAEPDEWTVIFRADDSLLWGKNAGDAKDDNGFATKLDTAPANMKFLRLRRIYTGDAVIIRVDRDHLGKTDVIEGQLVWGGGVQIRESKEKRNKLLGISRRDWSATKGNEHLVTRMAGKTNVGYRGWGFSKAAGNNQQQTYSWAGEPIEKTVFEIAVKSSDLTDDEKTTLLKSDAKDSVMETTTPTDSSPDNIEPTTRIARRQTSIHALYVLTQDTGQRLGVASELILTATPGKPRGKIPINFTTAAGQQMHLVLEDVVRAVNLMYPKVDVSKVELSFADKYTPKDGGSIGAAMGTLILSMIQGFEIDPKVAITGDVTADAKIRRIGGVAAKVRGAASAGCGIVALPTENYDQVVDAMVYEGTAFVVNTAVIGVANLDDAAAISRIDRDTRLSNAMKVFAEVQEALKTSPERVRAKEIQEKLASVTELAPNHYSAKLLLMVAQDKQPKRLSARASQYYTFVAVNGMVPILYERAKNKPQIPSAVIQDGLKNLDKVRRVADPQIIPLVDAWRNFIREVNDVAYGNANPQNLAARAQAVQDAMARMKTDRDLMQKMLNEGM